MVHPLTMANMSAKFDQEAHNSLVAIVTFDLQNQYGSSSHHG